MQKSKFDNNAIVLFGLLGREEHKIHFKIIEKLMGSGAEYYSMYRFDRDYIVNYPVSLIDKRAELFESDEKTIRLLYGKK